MATEKRRKPGWIRYTDEELLNLKFSELRLRLSDTVLQERIDRLYEELENRNISFRPHCWLSEEWFSPDGIPGIALPFYLAHPRLTKLESRQIFEVEGGSERMCMKILRHEAGHAINTAFQLHRRRRWKQIFGNYKKPYPTSYHPNPKSKYFVLHLDWWYAQSHPDEDFAETFAVWLKPRSKWRREYSNWPVLRKLEYMDVLMDSIADKTPLTRRRLQYEPLSRNNRTLRQYYLEKREAYDIGIPEVFDGELIRLFAETSDDISCRRSAATLLQNMQTDLCRICSRGTGEHPYVIAQIVQDMIVRCREMKLHVTRPVDLIKTDTAVFITVHILNYIHKVRHSITV